MQRGVGVEGHVGVGGVRGGGLEGVGWEGGGLLFRGQRWRAAGEGVGNVAETRAESACTQSIQ